MSVRPVHLRPGWRTLLCGVAGWLAAGCWAYPLNLDNTLMRSAVRERVPGTLHEIVHQGQGPVLDERHLVRNDTGKTDARVHAMLTQVGDDSYLLQLQSQDQGSADHYRFHVRVDPPKEISCRFGQWVLADVNLLSDDLTLGARAIDWRHGDKDIDVVFHRAQRAPMQFTGGQVQLSFRVVEACV